MGTLERNQQAFTEQSKGFSSEGDTYVDAEGLAWMLADLPTSPEAVALDVATGTGEFEGTAVTLFFDIATGNFFNEQTGRFSFDLD